LAIVSHPHAADIQEARLTFADVHIHSSSLVMITGGPFKGAPFIASQGQQPQSIVQMKSYFSSLLKKASALFELLYTNQPSCKTVSDATKMKALPH